MSLFEVSLGLFSVFYLFGLTCRKLMVKPKRLPAKVISIGNITLGGTGKTPAVIAIAEEAKKQGLHPCILTRGYKGKVKGPCFVKSASHSASPVGAGLCACPGHPQGFAPTKKGQEGDYSKHICTGLDAGDEPALMAERLKDVPIVKCADRYKGGQFAISNFKFQISNLLFILDDGFQHRALHRDVDILLIDATNPFGNEKLFPEGRLREPLSSIKRANIIVLTKADVVSNKTIPALIRKIKKYNSEAPVYTASHKPSSLVNVTGKFANLATLKNKKICAFAGIANPDYFKDTLIANGADIVKFKSFRDHHIYKQRDMDKIKTEAEGLDIITTEKDLVKLKEMQLPDNTFALRIEFSIEEDFFKHIF
ncbi:MAG: tetraacyldisaccharide 4'-kinase [Nitrospirae bacterium]|nr:tetraacyldisaccharide 4'-kinase [Nitrospirota bacterium]